MVTERRFTRFNRGKSTTLGSTDDTPLTTKEIPIGGLCLSSFLIVNESIARETVVMGKLNPSAPWDHLGALDPKRIEMHSKGWMLPSSHLIVHESPQDAARRIAQEQLDLKDPEISGPKVISEVYSPKQFPDLEKHWDIEFIFTTVNSKIPARTLALRELKYINPAETRKSEIARSHEDILASLGYTLLD